MAMQITKYQYRVYKLSMYCSGFSYKMYAYGRLFIRVDVDVYYPGEMVDILHIHLLIAYWQLLSYVHVSCLLLCDDRASSKSACGWWVVQNQCVLTNK